MDSKKVSEAKNFLLEFLRCIPEMSDRNAYDLKKNSDVYLADCLFHFYLYYQKLWEDDPSKINEEISERLWHLTSQLSQTNYNIKKNITLRRNRLIAWLVDVLVLFNCPKTEAIDAVCELLAMGRDTLDKICKQHCYVRKKSKSNIENILELRGQTLNQSPNIFVSLKTELNLNNLNFDLKYPKAVNAVIEMHKYILGRDPIEADLLELLLGKNFLPRPTLKKNI